MAGSAVGGVIEAAPAEAGSVTSGVFDEYLTDCDVNGATAHCGALKAFEKTGFADAPSLLTVRHGMRVKIGVAMPGSKL